MFQQNQTFLFYDLETSGINYSFDQVLQFAAIRTDLDFNEIERFNFFVKLNPDTTPSPTATITHHISIAKANTGISEYQAIKKIHKIINTPGTISIGYNTLGFDDEFLRFSFYRNMLPPYNHQFKNNCFRADLYPIITCYYLFYNNVLRWPKIVDEDGKEKVSLKLEHLNNENNLYNGGRAHDAITDVIVTVKIAKKLKQSNPKMWQFLLAKFNKQTDENTLSQLDIGLEVNNTKYKQAIAINGNFGYKNNFMSTILDIGQHKHYKNQEIFLRLDNYRFSDFIDEFGSLENEHWRLTVNKKWGDIPIILPVKTRFAEKLTQEQCDLIKENKNFIKNNSNVFANFIDYVLEYKYPEIANIDVDAAIYQSDFMSYADEKGCDKFHSLTIEQKAKMLSKLPKNFYDRAVRIIGRLDFAKLPEKAQIEFQDYLNKIVSLDKEELLIDHKGNTRKTLEDIYNEIEYLRMNYNLTEEQIYLLNELEEYLF
ncbi:MAG: exodeoxyribonuclease I [Francisella sp.]